MRTLLLLRHSLTEANARRLYCGATDLPLSEEGRALAIASREERPLPTCERLYSSGLRRADETLRLLTGRAPDRAFPALREMDFGAFEMRGYEELKDDPDYLRWIADDIWSGVTACPGGESASQFGARVSRGGAALLEARWRTTLLVSHGGVIAQLMRGWFPQEPRNYYQWQCGPCGGYRIDFVEDSPTAFEPL